MSKVQHGLLFCAFFLIFLNYYIFKENLFPEETPKIKSRVREIPEVGFQNDAKGSKITWMWLAESIKKVLQIQFS